MVEQGKLENPSLRCIIELLDTNQTSDFKLRKYVVIRILWRNVLSW